MSAIGAVFCRDGGEPPHGRLAAMSAALRGFGARTVHRRTGPTGLVRTVPAAGLAPGDACDPGVVAAGGGRLLLFDGRLHHRQDLIAAFETGSRAGARTPKSPAGSIWTGCCGFWTPGRTGPRCRRRTIPNGC